MAKIPVLIIGGGNIGQAIKHVLSNNAKVVTWDKDPRKSDRTPLDEAISKTQVIFICTPSWANREVARSITQVASKNTKSNRSQPLTPNPQLVVSVSKGMEPSGKLTSDILKEELGKKCRYGILAGPMIASELQKSQPTAALVALNDSSRQKVIKNLFENTNLSVSFSRDLKGLALCSVLKNIYAVALGIAAGLGAKANTRSVLTDLALQEMLAIVPMLGGKRETVLGVGGLGDLLTTGWSDKSYNFAAGLEIGHGKETKDSEGTIASQGIAKLLNKKIDRFAVLGTTCKIIQKKFAPAKLLDIVS